MLEPERLPQGSRSSAEGEVGSGAGSAGFYGAWKAFRWRSSSLIAHWFRGQVVPP
jgi:hypothetical protein